MTFRSTSRMYRRYGKRVIDVVASLALLIALAPLIALVTLAVALVLGRPVLFRQDRPGKEGRPFRLVKFRTMTESFDDFGAPLPDGQRLPRFGRFLRSTSIDELPELANVLMGHMSLVGPRPLLLEYLPRYTATQRRRHEIRPGITGLAQISGRNGLTWERRFELDVKYVDSYSFATDLRILIVTLVKMFRREGISQPGHPTASSFMGSSGS